MSEYCPTNNCVKAQCMNNEKNITRKERSCEAMPSWHCCLTKLPYSEKNTRMKWAWGNACCRESKGQTEVTQNMVCDFNTASLAPATVLKLVMQLNAYFLLFAGKWVTSFFRSGFSYLYGSIIMKVYTGKNIWYLENGESEVNIFLDVGLVRKPNVDIVKQWGLAVLCSKLLLEWRLINVYNGLPVS